MTYNSEYEKRCFIVICFVSLESDLLQISERLNGEREKYETEAEINNYISKETIKKCAKWIGVYVP